MNLCYIHVKFYTCIYIKVYTNTNKYKYITVHSLRQSQIARKRAKQIQHAHRANPPPPQQRISDQLHNLQPRVQTTDNLPPSPIPRSFTTFHLQRPSSSAPPPIQQFDDNKRIEDEIQQICRQHNWKLDFATPIDNDITEANISKYTRLQTVAFSADDVAGSADREKK